MDVTCGSQRSEGCSGFAGVASPARTLIGKRTSNIAAAVITIFRCKVLSEVISKSSFRGPVFPTVARVADRRTQKRGGARSPKQTAELKGANARRSIPIQPDCVGTSSEAVARRRPPLRDNARRTNNAAARSTAANAHWPRTTGRVIEASPTRRSRMTACSATIRTTGAESAIVRSRLNLPSQRVAPLPVVMGARLGRRCHSLRAGNHERS